jgi:hypothetical protein
MEKSCTMPDMHSSVLALGLRGADRSEGDAAPDGDGDKLVATAWAACLPLLGLHVCPVASLTKCFARILGASQNV